MSEALDFIPPERKSGEERLLAGGQPVSTLLSYWQWAGSDLLNNADRGILAEYIVALALGVHHGVRDPWRTYDLETSGGVKVEVKSGAYVQSWKQKEHSKIVFGIQPTHGWDPVAEQWGPERKRHADVYVFAVLAHKDQATINPLDLDQWEFYVVLAKVLDDTVGPQKTIGLAGVKRLGVQASFIDLESAVAKFGAGVR